MRTHSCLFSRSKKKRLMDRLVAAGGEEYALVCALSYRQTLGMNKLAVTWPSNGSLPVGFSRESGSGDDILTTDVIIDSAPFFLLFSSDWLYAQLRPIMEFNSDRYTVKWPYAYASHDMGLYPIADPRVDQESMPLEETCVNLRLRREGGREGGRQRERGREEHA